MREMRLKRRQVEDPAVINGIIAEMDACRVGFNDNGEVYIVPLSFGFEEEDGKYTFYFHGAGVGRKAELVRACEKAGVELDKAIQVKTDPEPCDHTVTYNSVIGHGDVIEITDPEEKKHGLNAVMKQNTGKGDWEFPEEMIKATFVFKVVCDWLTCKVHE